MNEVKISNQTSTVCARPSTSESLAPGYTYTKHCSTPMMAKEKECNQISESHMNSLTLMT